jgi:hypothetical protein
MIAGATASSFIFTSHIIVLSCLQPATLQYPDELNKDHGIPSISVLQPYNINLRPLSNQAATLKADVYAKSTQNATKSDAYIVRMEMLMIPVSRFACSRWTDKR